MPPEAFFAGPIDPVWRFRYESVMNADNAQLMRHLFQNEPGIYVGPYLEELRTLVDGARLEGRDAGEVLLSKRFDFVGRYCFPIPHHGLLQDLLPHGPFVEIGAGSGYLARALHRSGAKVSAYDKYPPGEAASYDFFADNAWYEDTWFSVVQADEKETAAHADETLLLSWPPPDDPMALNALEHYLKAGGRRVAYIGNPISSGDAAFHARLADLNPLMVKQTASWPGIGEVLMVVEGVTHG